MKACPYCGQEIQDEAVKCRHCGRELIVPPPTAPAPSPVPSPPQGPLPPGAPETNAKAIVSLILGILPLLGIGSIVAIVLGVQARREIDRSGGQQKGRGLATAGMILGIVYLALIALAVIALPTFLGARSRAQDKAAQSSLRNAMAAAKTYFTDGDTYGGLSPDTLSSIEPNLTYTTGSSTGSSDISLAVGSDGQSVGLAAKSDSGACFWIHDDATSGSTYAHTDGSGCTGADALGATGSDFTATGVPGKGGPTFVPTPSTALSGALPPVTLPSPADTAGFTTYSASQPVAYSLGYPASWAKHESSTGSQPAVLFSSGATSVNLSLEQLPPGITQTTYDAAAIQQLEKFGVTLKGTAQTEMGGQPATVILSTKESGGSTVELASIFTIHDGYAYVLTYAAGDASFDASLPTALGIAQSLTFG